MLSDEHLTTLEFGPSVGIVDERKEVISQCREANVLREENARLREQTDLLEEDINENLPRCILDDGTGDEASTRERIEFAGSELSRLTRECAEMLVVLRSWTSTCECHGTGTITRCVSASTKAPPETVSRPCFADFCKASRRFTLPAPRPGDGEKPAPREAGDGETQDRCPPAEKETGK